MKNFLHSFFNIPCGRKFLREFIFADWRFFVSCETYFCDKDRLVFTCWKLIFCDFQKVPSTQH